MTETLSDKLRNQAQNVEGDGWLNAARHMAHAADVLEQDVQAYATLRVALRHAIQRVVGVSIGDVAPIYRAIEKGMSLGDATDQLEVLLRQMVEQKQKAKQEPKPIPQLRPDNCRNALRDAGKMHPRSGCDVCGNGGILGCPYERLKLKP